MCLRMSALVITMADFSSPMILSLKTATHGEHAGHLMTDFLNLKISKGRTSDQTNKDTECVSCRARSTEQQSVFVFLKMKEIM